MVPSLASTTMTKIKRKEHKSFKYDQNYMKRTQIYQIWSKLIINPIKKEWSKFISKNGKNPSKTTLIRGSIMYL